MRRLRPGIDGIGVGDTAPARPSFRQAVSTALRQRTDMKLVLGFVPFILFATLMRLSDDLALWITFAAAFTLGMRSFLDTRVLKTIDAGSTALFGLLALYKGFIQPSLSSGVV